MKITHIFILNFLSFYWFFFNSLQILCQNSFYEDTGHFGRHAKLVISFTNKQRSIGNCYLCFMLSSLKKTLSLILSLPVYFYRYAISPLLRPSCRHVPSCSQYALDSLRIHGPVTGLMLATNRILRCRPGGTHGYDPVPRILIKRYRPFYSFFFRCPSCNRLKR